MRSRAILRHWKPIVGVILAAVCLTAALRGVDWAAFASTLRDAHPGLILLSCGFGLVGCLLRAFRWQLMLSTKHPVAFDVVFWSNMAGYFANSVLPARAGEFARSALISSQTGLAPVYVLTSAAAERVADALALALLGTVAILVGPPMQESLKFVFLSLLAGIFLLTVTILLLPALQQRIRILRWRPASDTGIAARVFRLLNDALAAMEDFGRVMRSARFLFSTAGIWASDIAAAVVLASALNLSLSWSGAALLLAAIGLASALPSAPAYVGTFQFVALTVLPPFGLSRAEALAYILVMQGTGVAMNALLGSWSFFRVPRSASYATTENS